MSQLLKEVQEPKIGYRAAKAAKVKAAQDAKAVGINYTEVSMAYLFAMLSAATWIAICMVMVLKTNFSGSIIDATTGSIVITFTLILSLIAVFKAYKVRPINSKGA